MITKERCFALSERANKVLDGLRMSDRVLVYWLALKADGSTGDVGFQRNAREEFCSFYGVASQTVSNSVFRLRRAGILVSLGSGNYRFNKGAGFIFNV
jgi:hypothetical protein